MSRTILSEVDGFTPVIDEVVKATSLMSAVVFGRIWRFCQMPDGVCNASLETISEDIGIDKASVMRHAKILVEQGYLEDLSPDLRNHPHTYKDTGKAAIPMVVSGVAHGNAGVAQNQLKIDSKKESKTEGAAAVFKTYEAEIGLITSKIADSINDLLDHNTPTEWIVEALEIASKQNHRSWAYAEAVLKRWAVDGKSDKPKQSEPSYYKRPAMLDEDESKYVIPE